MPDLCRYDPDGQLVVPCTNAAPWLAFDGANVTRGGTWSFIHGPGVDDPLIGLNRWPTGQLIELYYVTDGNGRQYTVARGDGSFSEDDQSLQGNAGWNYAGGNLNAHTFTADRMASAEAPGLAFYRNRVYDQASGRWTQEDPIGIAGGINLYQFNGNNPVTFTDPFGLKLCVAGKARKDIERTKTAIGEAVDMDIDWDNSNCVTAFKSRGNRNFDLLQDAFRGIVLSRFEFTATLGAEMESPQLDPLTIRVFGQSEALAYPTGPYGKCGGGGEAFSLRQLFAHELVHHAPVAYGRPMNPSEHDAIIQGDNVFNAARGKAPRCSHSMW